MRCPRCNTLLPDNAQVCGNCGEDLEIPYNPELDLLWEEESHPETSHVSVTPGRHQHQQSEVVYTSARQTNEQPAGRPFPPLHLDDPPPPPPEAQARPAGPAPAPAPAPPRPPPPVPAPEPGPGPGRPAFGEGAQAEIATHILDSELEPEPARQAFGAQAEIATNILDSEPKPAAELPAPAPAPAEPEPQPARPAFGGGAQANIATHIVDADPEKDRDTRIVDVSVPAMVRRAKQDQPAASAPGRRADSDASKSEPLEDLGVKIRLFYARMHRVDRLTFWINLLTFISAFLPWRNVLGHGLVSGIEGLGGASAGAALVVAVCIYSRTARRRVAGLVLFLQLIAAAGIVAVPVYLFFYHTGLSVHVGFITTALGGAAIVVLTFARMAVRSF